MKVKIENGEYKIIINFKIRLTKAVTGNFVKVSNRPSLGTVHMQIGHSRRELGGWNFFSKSILATKKLIKNTNRI